MCTGADGYALSAVAATQESATPISAPARHFAPPRRHHPMRSSPAKAEWHSVAREATPLRGKRHKGNRGIAFMADGTKRVFTVNGPAHKVYYEIVGKRSDVRLDTLKNDSSDDVATP